MEYMSAPDGLSARQFAAFHEERLRLMERYAKYNDLSIHGRPKKAIIAVRLTRKGEMMKDASGNDIEEFYETVKHASKAMKIRLVMMMALARGKRERFNRVWRYATRDDLEHHGIL